MRQSYFVLTFPFSNVGLAQVFPGENAECVCQALKNIFEYVSGVPVRIVFDNATGVGRRISNETRTSRCSRPSLPTTASPIPSATRTRAMRRIGREQGGVPPPQPLRASAPDRLWAHVQQASFRQVHGAIG